MSPPWTPTLPPERVDRRSPWRAGCRLLQAWWRDVVLDLPAGPGARGDRPVANMLPKDAPADANFLSRLAFDAAERRIGLERSGGLVDADRLRRNLLSSQPLCFNLFGHLDHHHGVLLDWIDTLGVAATEIEEVRLEWAPPKEQHLGGGSAFDAWVAYRRDGARGFLGIEVKYAEDLAEQRITTRDVYLEATADPAFGFAPGAEERLNQPTTVQLWLNLLLAKSLLLRDLSFDEGNVVLLSCAADEPARGAAAAVAGEVLAGPTVLVGSHEQLVDLAAGRRELGRWAATFRRRYLDFAPVAHLLAADDQRRRP